MSGLDDYDSELYEAIEELVAEGTLEAGTPAHGIAMQFRDRGYESLSSKQRFVFDNETGPAIESKLKEWRGIQIANSAGD